MSVDISKLQPPEDGYWAVYSIKGTPPSSGGLGGTTVTGAPFSATTPKPAVATTLKPSTATTLKPSVATTLKPSTATTLKPSVATTLKPSVATTLKPSVATTLKPSVATTLKPSTSTTAKPSVVTTLKPSTSTTAKPSVVTTLKPSTSTTAKPSVVTTQRQKTMQEMIAESMKPSVATTQKQVPVPASTTARSVSSAPITPTIKTVIVNVPGTINSSTPLTITSPFKNVTAITVTHTGTDQGFGNQVYIYLEVDGKNIDGWPVPRPSALFSHVVKIPGGKLVIKDSNNRVKLVPALYPGMTVNLSGVKVSFTGY